MSVTEVDATPQKWMRLGTKVSETGVESVAEGYRKGSLKIGVLHH